MKKIYSEEFKNVLVASRYEAFANGEKIIRLEHFLLGMLHADNNDSYKVISQKTAAMEHLRVKLRERLGTYGSVNIPFDVPNGAINLDTDAGYALQGCMTEADSVYTEKVMSTHLLLAVLRSKDSFVSSLLADVGVTYDYVRDCMYEMYDIEPGEEPDAEEQRESDVLCFGDSVDGDGKDFFEKKTRPDGSQTAEENDGKSRKPARALEFLKKFGNDITADAVKGKLDPVVGREMEIERLAQILSRRKKNNPILIGEAGVGKTAIVEGLAQRIVERKVPVTLFDKRIVSLNMASVVAGTKYRGQFEDRLQNIVRELVEHPEVILFIDEIHTLIGAGASQGTMDAANILKPALSRGQLQCIGATTIDEYRKTIEKDGAMERRFQKIIVNPTTVDETIAILNNIKSKYEEHHNVRFTDSAIGACVRLTDRYISDRQLPDKAIDAMDEAGSRKHMMDVEQPENLKLLSEQITETKKQRDGAVSAKSYNEATRLRTEIDKLKEDYETQMKSWLDSLKDKPAIIDEKDVEYVVSAMSGVPVHKMAQTEGVKLKELKTELSRTIIAQDRAIEKLVKAITRNRIGLRDPNKPIGTFLFLGPTGVGKTYLAKKLADYMFGTEEALIRLDMSEYMEKFSTSRLIGAPPGYVGYEEGGQLTEKVRRRPYSIILFDEIEKANKDVFNILLQVMDEGRLTDNNGVTVDFRNTILILTSNCGSRELQDFGNGVGFSMRSEQESKNYADGIIMKSLNKQFAPEFINRIDDIILFDNLNKETIGRIIDNELEMLNLRMIALGYSLEIDKKAKDFLVEKSYDRRYGARPLKRAIQTYVEDGISDYILEGGAKENLSSVIHISKSAKKEELCFD